MVMEFFCLSSKNFIQMFVEFLGFQHEEDTNVSSRSSVRSMYSITAF